MKRWWVLAIALWGCAPVAPGQTGVSEFRDAWFTNVDRAGPHTYESGSEPRRLWPEVTVFERGGKDPRVILIVQLAQGGSHLLRATLRPPEGNPRPLEWSLAAKIHGGRWRTASASWRTDRLTPGLYHVDLTVDGADVGTYAFTIK